MPSLGWERAYRSGDLVVNEAGPVFAGRADDQVKLGGRRIELGGGRLARCSPSRGWSARRGRGRASTSCRQPAPGRVRRPVDVVRPGPGT